MNRGSLSGCTILVVEDEPLIALDIVDGLKAAGAVVFGAHTVRDGVRFVDHPDLSAAILDFGLSDGDGTALCARLNERRVPFILHTGYTHVHEACRAGVVVPKPATPYQLVSAVEKLLRAC